MGLADTGKNVGLNAIAAAITHLSLHTDAIGGGSANEATGGSPAYARKAATWGAAATGTVSLTNQPVFDVPVGTYRRVGFYSAITGGTYYGDGDITDEVFAAQGTYTITSGSISITG